MLSSIMLQFLLSTYLLPPDSIQAAYLSNRATAPVLPNFESLVVFGDSYSDNCNLWRLVDATPEQLEEYPIPTCPPAPLGRSDDGSVWAEFLATGTGLELLDFAVASATCSNTYFPSEATNSSGTTITLPDVGTQISQWQAYSASNESFNSETTLAFVFIGTNDLGRLIFAPGTAATLINEVLCVSDSITQLYQAGVRNMIVMNNAPLASLPIYAANSTFNSTTLNPIYGDLPSFNGSTVYERMVGLVDANIAMQQVMLQALITTLPDATLRVFDTYSYINGLIADPIPVFGPDANTTGFCACSDAACDYCTDPERYLWQNTVHPTQAFHQALAATMAEFIGLGYTNPLAT
ncbi:MAG: hypothetical protein CYPHOPRED_004241 [Cyphobasidiales sp. Tagirdzhanova-0007]|nr:MAG: hypothetical protein CYPHOPRED_004241 [Cyphobasidiales sp. Tagirdzhanova-0007]